MWNYSQVVRYLQHTYASDDIVSEAKLDFKKFTQPARMSEMYYSQALWLK